MQVVIVYESASGATRRIAEAVGAGLSTTGGANVTVLPVAAATPADLSGADLVVVGGPTHHDGGPTHHDGGSVDGAALDGPAPSGPSAAERSDGPDDRASIDLVGAPDLPTVGPGLRRWFHRLPATHGRVAAAFDTRVAGERGAAGVIARRLGRHGYRVVAAEGFVVDGPVAPIAAAELVRARQWGADLAHQVASAVPR